MGICECGNLEAAQKGTLKAHKKKKAQELLDHNVLLQDNAYWKGYNAKEKEDMLQD